MFRTLSPRSIAFLSVVLSTTGASFGSAPSRIVPSKGEKLSFTRTYKADFLKNHPLQMVKKTSFALKNTKGLLTGTWTATIRDIRTDEAVEATATGLCKSRGARKVECTFDATTGTVNLASVREGVLVSIPVGQGVLFSREKDGLVWSEILLGADDDNNEFHLNRK